MDNKDLLKAMLELEFSTLNTNRSSLNLEVALELITTAHKLGRAQALQEYSLKSEVLEKQNAQNNPIRPAQTENAPPVNQPGGESVAIQSSEEGTGRGNGIYS